MKSRFRQRAYGLYVATALRRSLPFPPAIVLGLAALAPAPLMAAVTLDLAGVPESVQSGKAFSILVKVQGDPQGQELTVKAWDGDVELFTRTLAPDGSGCHQVTIRDLPAPDTPRQLRIQARCGTAESRAVRTWLLPRPGAQDPREEKDERGPAQTKRARVEEASASTSSSSSPLLALPPQNLLPEPKAPLETKEARAPEGLQKLVIEGDPTDAELKDLLLRNRWVRTLEFSSTKKLTSEGIVSALEPCRMLEELEFSHYTGCPLTFGDLLRIVRGEGREHLVKLCLPYLELRDDQVAQLPERMTALNLKSQDLQDDTFLRFVNLKRLVLHGPEVLKGIALPAGLKQLGIYGCDRFTGTHLPDGLEELSADGCCDFTGTGLPRSLTSLSVEDCSEFAGHRDLPNLKRLELDSCDKVTNEVVLAMVRKAASLEHLSLLSLPDLDHLEIVRQAPSVTSLQTDQIKPALVHALPPRLVSLDLAERDGDEFQLEGNTFAHLNRLQELSLCRVGDFTGLGLPASLRSLSVCYCPSFESQNLGGLHLERLKVFDCDGFAGLGLPGSLQTLHMSGCSKVTREHLGIMLGQLRSLAFLRHIGFGPFRPDSFSDLFASHPTLQEAVWHSDPDLTARFEGSLSQCAKVWRRPAPPSLP